MLFYYIEKAVVSLCSSDADLLLHSKDNESFELEQHKIQSSATGRLYSVSIEGHLKKRRLFCASSLAPVTVFALLFSRRYTQMCINYNILNLGRLRPNVVSVGPHGTSKKAARDRRGVASGA